MNSLPGKSAKKVVFHIGFPKTGSSALQAFLSANAAALDEGGVFYPYPEPNAVVVTGNCTGNMIQIMYRDGFVERYKSPSGGPVIPAKILDRSYFSRIGDIIEKSNHSNVIFSSEAFGSASSTALEYFKDTIFDRHDTTLVGFVRDPFDSAYSSWRQHVKTQKTALTFKEFVTGDIEVRSATTMMRNFAKLRSVGLEPVLVNYDTFRADIIGKFFEIAELPRPQSGEHELSGEHYNSSLTAAEAALVRMANAQFPSGDFPAMLSKLLLKRPAAERRSGNFYSAYVDNALLRAHGSLIEHINKSIIGEPLRTTVRSEPDSIPAIGNAEISCLLEAANIALRAAAKREARSSIYAWAKSLLSRKPTGLPHGFSPEAYLFHNEDVACAGVDPGLHYLSHGRLEERRYRFS